MQDGGMKEVTYEDVSLPPFTLLPVLHLLAGSLDTVDEPANPVTPHATCAFPYLRKQVPLWYHGIQINSSLCCIIEYN